MRIVEEIKGMENIGDEIEYIDVDGYCGGSDHGSCRMTLIASIIM